MDSTHTTIFAVTRAYLVHVLTASGVVFAFLAAAEIASPACDPRWVFLWFACATLVDAVDGPLARRWGTKDLAARFDGRKIDDLVDYLLFTFLPLLLVWRMGWLPFAGGPHGGAADAVGGGLRSGVWIVPAMVVSLLGFANNDAKQEEAGFFAGFPSYWNIVAFYAGLFFVNLAPPWGAWLNAAMIVVLTVLTLAPVRCIYPNLAPWPWKWPLLGGAAAWAAGMLAMLPWYPRNPAWAVWLSLIYPAVYTAASVCLDVRARRGGGSRP